MPRLIAALAKHLAVISVLLLLITPPALGQCNPSYDPDCGTTPGMGPDVGMTPDGGSFTAEGVSLRVPVTIFFSDADGLNTSTLQIRLWNGGSAVGVALPFTASDDGTRGTANGEIELRLAGDNILVAQMSDKLGNPGSGRSTFRLNFVDPELPVVFMDPQHNEYRDTSLGGLVLAHPGPTYTSMGLTRSAGLMHNSELARPTAFIQVDAYPDPRTASQVTMLSLRIERWNNGATGTQPLLIPEVFYRAGGVKQRLAAHWNWTVTSTPTGAYKFWLAVRSYKADGTFKETRKPIRFLILNELGSRYGAGWIVAGVKRLYVSGTDGVLLHEGNGILKFFTGSCAGAQGNCSYTTPAGDFSKLIYSPATAGWLRTFPDGAQESYSSGGLLTTSGDRFGNSTTVQWQTTADGTNTPVVQRITDPVGQSFTFAYDASWYLRSISGPGGRTVSVVMGSGRAITSIAGPPNLQMTWSDSNRKVATYNWNYSAGSVTDPGATVDVLYDDAGKIASVTAAPVVANGASVRPKTVYRSLEKVVVPPEFWDPAKHGYDKPAPAVLTENALAEATDPGGHVSKVGRDRYGNPTRSIDAAGRTTTMTWTEDGLAESVSEPNKTSGNLWNSNGQLLMRSVNGSVVYEASYNLQNLPEFEMSGGQKTWYAYGSRGELIRSWTGKKEDESRTATTYEYNARFQATKTAGPKGEKSEMSYEGNDWRNADYARVTREDGTLLITTYTYDDRGRSRTITNPLNQTATMEWDAADRPTRITDPAGLATVYEYTGAYLTKVTAPQSKVYQFTYNALGWLQSDQSPGDPRPRRYAYNADGLPVTITDRRDRTISRAYDAGHRITGITADGATTTFGYPDPYSVVVTNAESAVTTAGIAGVGQLGSVSATLGGRLYEIKRRLDPGGSWRDIGFDLRTYLNGVLQRTDTVEYLPDYGPADPALSGSYSIKAFGGTTTTSLDTSGRPVRVAFPNNVTQHNFYRTDGRLDATTFSSSAVNQKLGASFSYDLLNRFSTRLSAQQDRLWAYGYDNLGQLTEYGIYKQATLGGCNPAIEECPPADWFPVKPVEYYSYDASGNRTDRGGTVAAGTNRYTAFDGFAFDYDSEGNVIRKYKSGYEQRFTWNTLGQLVEVVTNGATVSYGYDGLGRRVRRTEGGQTRYFLYDGDDLLVETDYNGAPWRTYTHWRGTDNPHSVRVTSGGVDYLYYYTMEQPGHVTGLLNSLGGVAAEHHYTPFGQVESSSDASGQPLRFMARELDSATGLYYVRNRWYDPSVARFLTQDPIGLGGGLNTYAYAGNNPLNLRDPNGLTPECPNCLPTVYVVCAWRRYDPNCDGDSIFQTWNDEYNAWVAADRPVSRFDFGQPDTPRPTPREPDKYERFFADLSGRTAWLNDYVELNVQVWAEVFGLIATGGTSALRGRLVLAPRGITAIGHMADVNKLKNMVGHTVGGWDDWDNFSSGRKLITEVRFIRDAINRGDAIKIVSPDGGGLWTTFEATIARLMGAPVF